MRTLLSHLLLTVIFCTFSFKNANSCTSIIVSKGASTDGSVMTSWTYDMAGFMAPLQFYAGGEYEEGDSLNIYGFRVGEYLGRIAQVPKTYRVVGNMNEKQVSISETTFTGREELHGGEGVFDYGNLIYITLQRASTAREAIKIMDELARTYGYRDTGETFSIADKNEAWMMDFIGKGEHGKGAVWAAARIPDGYIAAHANQARIRNIDWKDTENWMWADDLVDFAKEMGWFKGNKRNFSFVDAYAPVTPISLLLCEGRVWSVYRNVAPSKNFSSDYWRCVEGAEPYPLFIKPDNKISIEDMIALHRDHFHNSPYYTAKESALNPFKNPYKWRPIFFELENDTMQYAWERPIAQYQTAFSFITQARSDFPDKIGGICWYSVDDNYSNAWMPLYMGLNRVPPSLAGGSPIEFEWESAFWVFSLVNNYMYGLYKHIIEDVQKVQKEVEDRAVMLINAVDKAAMELYENQPDMLEEYLTDFSINNVEHTVQRWRELGKYIFVKYNDRYIREKMEIDSWPQGIGYPEVYFEQAVKERPGYYDVKWRKKAD